MRHEEIEKAEAAVETAKSALKDLESEILTANRDRYEAAGGCRACLGEGVTWQHYHDGDSAKSVCYACGGKCDKSIVYDGDRFKDPETQTRYDGAYEDLKLAKLFFERAQELYSLGKGVTVEVVKGRKVRKGTRGVVIAESTSCAHRSATGAQVTIAGPACCVWCRKEHETRIARVNLYGRPIREFVPHPMCADSLTGADYSDLPFARIASAREQLIENARFALRRLTDEERLSALDFFCKDCGRITDQICYCTNDE